MNWKKAKNLMLIFLVILNLMLLGFNTISRNKYKMTWEQEKNILAVLSEYNIGLYVELPQDYKPMYDMRVINKGNSISEELKEICFDTDVFELQEDDKYTYQNETGTLTVENGYFNYVSLDGVDSSPDDIINKFSGLYDDLMLDKVIYDDSDYVLYEYRDVYRKNIYYSNYVEVEVKDDLITRVSGYNSETDQYIGEPKEIISVDMALINFAKEIKRTYGEEGVFIDNIDIVYYLYDEPLSEEGVALKAIPCYRISVEGSSRPFLINAYDNNIVNLY